MVKGSSLLLVGSGIAIYGIFTILIDLVNPQNILDVSDNLDYFSDFAIGIFGLILGCLLMFIGVPKFINEKQKTETLEPKRVSLIWQIIGSVFPGFDLLVMYRIKKLRRGIPVFVIQYAIFILVYTTGLSLFLADRIQILTGIGYAIIVLFWSRKWNKQFEKQSKNNGIQ